MLYSVSPNWAPISGSTQATLQVTGAGFMKYTTINCEIGEQVTAVAVVHSDTSLTCVVTLSNDISQLSSSGHFLRLHAMPEDVDSNILSFFYEAPPHITSVTIMNPSRGFKRLSIVGSNFKENGVWCDFGSSMTRPITRGALLSCPIPTGMTHGTVKVFQDGQSSNEVSWSM